MIELTLKAIKVFSFRFFWNTIILFRGSEDGIYLHLYPWEEEELERFLQAVKKDALALAKMGFENIMVYDDDTVETENMNSQFFRFSDIGKLKVEALQDLIKDFTGVVIDYYPLKYEGKEKLNGIIISAVDSMEARQMIWDAHKSFSTGTKLIIDPRMAAETALIYSMNPMDSKDIKAYEKTLYSDNDSMQERCTAKSIMFTVLLIAGQVSKIIKDFVCDKNYARITQWSIEEDQQFVSRTKKEVL